MDSEPTKEPENGYGEGMAQFTVRMPDELCQQIDERVGSRGRAAFIRLAVEEMLARSLRDPVNRIDRIEHDVRDLLRRVKDLEER